MGGYESDGIPASRLRVIMNAVSRDRIDASATSGPPFELPAGARVVCVLGSIIERKRPLDVVEAAALLYSEHPDMHVVFLGDGALRPAVESRIADLGLSARVHVLGRREDAAAVMARHAELVIAPSEWEAMPLNVIEAQAAAKCVIASDIPPHMELVQHGVNGWLYPLGDINALAGLMRVLLADERKRHDTAAAAFDQASRDFSMERFVAEFETLYGDIKSMSWVKILPGVGSISRALLPSSFFSRKNTTK